MFFALLLRVFFLNVYHVSNTNKVSLYHTQSAAEWEVCAPRLKFKLLREERRKERERREEREREKRLLFVTQKRVFFLQYDAKVKSRIFQKEREKKKEKQKSVKREKFYDRNFVSFS